ARGSAHARDRSIHRRGLARRAHLRRREPLHPAEGETPRRRRRPPKALSEFGAPRCPGPRVPSRERCKRSFTMTQRLYRACVVRPKRLLGLTFLALLWTAPSEVEAANAGFVSAQGGEFVLNGGPFRFVGTNSYYMPSAATYSKAHVDDTLSLANSLGFTVLRTWGFYDGSGSGALQPSPGSYNESAFQALDYVLYKADLAGVRLLIALVNYWPDYGGVPQYVQWRAPGQGNDAFYTNATCKQMYKNYVSHVLNRVNSLNGRPYKTDPTVFAWELANEPRSGDRTGTIVNQWAAEMAAYIKSIDSNHMVGTGEEGFDTT